MSNFFGITKIKDAQSRLITAENVYGEKGKGGMAPLTVEPQPEVVKIGQVWEIPNECARELGEKWKVRPSITLPKQSVTTIMDVCGPGTITHMWMFQDNKYYRDNIIRAYWDDEETPSIEVPLGDFFCCGFKTMQNIQSIPINVNPTGAMNSYFPMPFRKHAKITIENRACEDIQGFFYAISFELGEVCEDEAYFHAQFRRTNPLIFGEDYVILDNVKGTGHYVGTQMCWQQNCQGWWGEGELKVFIDGDNEYPTYCGTGTEDYFGGAWCFRENYSAPFLGYCDLMTLGDKPRTTNTVGNRHNLYRFHIMDPIRFKTDLKLTMQAIRWRSEKRFQPLKDDISSVAYWYQNDPHNSFPALGDCDALDVI